jgi:predicted AlkP superfamily pyrophosphatase or phosphodiesterase
MIHDLRQTKLASQRRGKFILPAYGGHCFSDIPNTILSLFGIDPQRPVLSDEILASIKSRNFKNIILLLIDGFGFDDWITRATHYPFFKRLCERGDLYSLTAVFPSTTSASLTTFFSTLTPQEHGLPEWNIYLKEVDGTIQSLPFKRWAGKCQDELADEGLDPKLLFDGKTIFEKLKAGNVASTCFNQRAYAYSAYSTVTRRGSTGVGFQNGSDLIVQLRKRLQSAPAPHFHYVYWDAFDNLEHTYSPQSEETNYELENISHMFNEQFLARLDRKTAEETLLLVTADHGHVPVLPEHLTLLSNYREVMAALQQSPAGKTIYPTGNIRDLILYIRPDKVVETKQFLDERLRGKAEVWYTHAAIKMGLFGLNDATERFRERAGNLWVLPYEDQSVWVEYPEKKDKGHFRGHHGGLSPTEMFIPLGVATLAELMD